MEATERVIDAAACLEVCKSQVNVWLKHKCQAAQYMLAIQDQEDAWKKRTQKAMERLDFEAGMHATRLDLYHKQASNVEPSRELNKKAMQIYNEAQKAFKEFNETTKKRRFKLEGVDDPTPDAIFDIPTLSAVQGNADSLMPDIMPDLDDEDGSPAKRSRAEATEASQQALGPPPAKAPPATIVDKNASTGSGDGTPPEGPSK